MEKELNRDEVQPNATPSVGQAGVDQGSPDQLEIAHVLFMDLVSFSTGAMEDQRRTLRKLQEIVLNTPQARESERTHSLIRLPTGDGMALVFFGDPVACLQCAIEMSPEVKNNGLRLRMGINTGPVYRVADINANMNVAGGGINMAQRVMDAGDAGHILMSKSSADILQQLKTWAPYLHDIGVHPVKHGVKIQFYNFYNGQAGNALLPAKFRQRHRARTRLQAMIAVACLLLAAAAFYWYKRSAANTRTSVAVLGFRNINARPGTDWVSTGLADGLRSELAITRKVRMVSGEDAADISKDLGLTRFDSLGKKSLARIHDRGADIVVAGSYTDLDDRIHVNIDIQDTTSGETVDSLVADGSEAEFSQLVKETGQRLRAKLGLGDISVEKERQVALSQPSPEAAPAYSDGLSNLRAYRPIEARSYLERALISDAAFPYAHAALAEAYFTLGFDGKAKDEAKKAFDLSKSLSFEDRTSIEGRYRGITSDWPAAVGAYQRLYDYAPQNLDYGLKLAEAQRSAGRGKDASKTLARLRKLPAPNGDDPRIDLEEAEVAASVGDLSRGLQVAGNAVQKAKERGARLLESRSLIWSCDAKRRLGQMDSAKQDCEDARKIATDLDDSLDSARAVNNLANILSDQGDLEGARQLFEQALSLGRKIGDQRDVSGALNNLGIVLLGEGKLEDAKQSYEAALNIQQEIGFTSEIPNTLENIGDLLHQQGNLSDAEHTFEQAIAAAQQSGNEGAEAGSKANLATVLVEIGDPVQGERDGREAVAMERRRGAKSDLAETLDILGDVLTARGNLQEAEKSYREALTSQEALREKGTAAITEAGLANVMVEQGHSQQAEATVRRAVTELHLENDFSDEAAARLVLVKALLDENKVPEAAHEMDATSALITKSSPSSVRYAGSIVSARVHASSGAAQHGKADDSGPVAELRRIARDAEAMMETQFALEARLTIAEIERNGAAAQARADATAVQNDAAAKGFVLISQKAAKLLR